MSRESYSDRQRRDDGDAPARCRSCGGDIVWIKTKAGKNMPVQILRKDGTGADKRDTFAQGTHVPHWQVCPYAESHRKAKVKAIVDKALDHAPAPSAPPPPVAEMTDADLTLAAKWYRGRKKLGPRAAARLADIVAEQDRRRVDRLPPRTVEDYSDQ